MTTIIIFFASVLAIIFFVIGNVFNVIASGLKALMNALSNFIFIGIGVVFTVIAMYLFYEIVNEFLTNGLSSAIFSVVLLMIILFVVVGIIGGFGLTIFGFVATLALFAVTNIVALSELAAGVFEIGYAKSLNVIINQLDKC